MNSATDKVLELKAQGLTWREIGRRAGLSSEAARSRYRWAKGTKGAESRRAYRPRKMIERLPEVNGDHVTDESEGNTRILESQSRRIKTLDELLEACKVDLEQWIVDHYVVNKWEVGRKATKTDLTFEQGKITGSILDKGNIFVEPLFQVKAWLLPRRPKPIGYVVNPISISVHIPKMIRQTLRQGKRELILPDIQFGFSRDVRTGQLTPYHDRAALDVALQIAGDFDFDGVTYLGDILDLAEWTDKFIKSPEFYWTTQSAVIEAGWWIAQFRVATKLAKTRILEGNHDSRMEDAMVMHLGAAYQLKSISEVNQPPALSVPKLLDLDSLGIEWIGDYPDGCVWLSDNLRCVHGGIANSGAGDTAKAMIEKSSSSVIFGHIHRIEQATKTIYERDSIKTVTAVSPGCLCRIDCAVPGHQKAQNWQHGFAVATYGDSGYHSIEVVPIQNGHAIYSGKQYVARDRLSDLVKDTGWKF